jgi:hypothetical protein
MNARERDAESPDRRRWLVRALAAMPAMLLLSPFPRAVRAQSDQEKGQYVLSSEGRARQIRQLVSSDLADKLRSLADGGLGRELHPRAVIHTQGLLPHEQDRDASLLSQEDWRQTLVQGLAWCVSGDAAYLGACERRPPGFRRTSAASRLALGWSRIRQSRFSCSVLAALPTRRCLSR